MTPNAQCHGVLIIGFGGPTSSAEIRPFLDRVLKGRPVPPERYEEVVRHYERLGGYSPYNEITMRQAGALRELMRRQGATVPVAVGFRNSPPYIDEALGELMRRGVRRVLGFILAAYRCEASWERYQDDVEDARGRLGADAPEVKPSHCVAHAVGDRFDEQRVVMPWRGLTRMRASAPNLFSPRTVSQPPWPSMRHTCGNCANRPR